MSETPTTDASKIPNDDENLAVRLAETEVRLLRAGVAALALELQLTPSASYVRTCPTSK